MAWTDTTITQNLQIHKTLIEEVRTAIEQRWALIGERQQGYFPRPIVPEWTPLDGAPFFRNPYNEWDSHLSLYVSNGLSVILSELQNELHNLWHRAGPFYHQANTHGRWAKTTSVPAQYIDGPQPGTSGDDYFYTVDDFPGMAGSVADLYDGTPTPYSLEPYEHFHSWLDKMTICLAHTYMDVDFDTVVYSREGHPNPIEEAYASSREEAYDNMIASSFSTSTENRDGSAIHSWAWDSGYETWRHSYCKGQMIGTGTDARSDYLVKQVLWVNAGGSYVLTTMPTLTSEAGYSGTLTEVLEMVSYYAESATETLFFVDGAETTEIDIDAGAPPAYDTPAQNFTVYRGTSLLDISTAVTN